MKKTIVFIILFLIIIVGFFGFWYYRDKVFSKEILRLEILAPENTKMGEEIEYTVKYKNNGNFILENPKLIFELPENSLTEDSKTRFAEDLPNIYPGDEDFVKFKGRLLGKDNDLKVARAWLSYTPKNLTARYESDTTFTTKIETVPITIDFDLPSKAEKGKELSYSLNYFSNIDYPLENLSVKIDDVYGFNFEKSEPISLDNLEWKIPTLEKTQGGRIKITGLVTAEKGKQLNFRAYIGMWQQGQFITIKEKNVFVDIIEPQIFISQQINGSLNYVANPGENLHFEIFFRNIGSSAFENLLVLAKFNSPAFETSSISATGGEIRQQDNLIAFDYKQNPELKYLAPGQEGKIGFDVKLKDNWEFSESERNNLFIKNTIQVLEVSQQFSTKVNSKLEISQKGYYSSQAGITNFGPLPPKVGEVTTYVITWQVKNFSNDAKNVKVKAVMPQGISLTGFIEPETELARFTLDSLSRELIWSIGDVKAGQTIAPMSFQISLTPQIYQQFKAIDLLGQATIYGEDQFTNALIQNTAPAINTNLADDLPNYNKGTIQ
ncbi:MAG: hypothetical protein A2256_00155 [Candidatus Staskawiczbacteria bacterium RIFOXYA2_FULL_32_7]|nr:MAG: hypothetical protein A2256_00155 [Candidatus Staskawiczbacteria bacterium RIFOXYA2_FULL_32_7]